MKNLLVLLLIGLSLGAKSQEVLSPMSSNPSLYPTNESIKSRGLVADTSAIDSTFIYTYGSLAITDIWDDFSVNKFVQYPPSYTAPNVTSQWFYHLMDQTNSTPELVNVKYCDSSKSHHDTISVVAGLTSTFYHPFTSQQIWINDFSAYPIGGQVIDVYNECYVLIDSVIDGVPDPTQDTIWYTNDPTYYQDSVHIFFANMNDPNQIWVDNQACHNYRFAIDPWSLGVATFDGVDSTGMPYSFGANNAHGYADVLTSKSINLLGTSNVYLQFLYQSGGHGNMPESEDSLVVEFYQPDSMKWYNQGYIFDLTSADEWDTLYTAVPIPYLKNGFRFRIRNKASLTGALDHWHIDYVRLYENPLGTVQPFNDLAISYPLNSLLDDYTSVPWDHYQNLANQNEAMLDTGYLHVYNSDATPTNVGSSSMFLEISYDGSVQGTYNLPNPGAIPPWTSNWELGTNEFPFFVAANHTFSASGNDTMATFDVKINADADVAASNVYTINDTTYMQQSFKNYYAYDDGSAEKGYGVQGSNSQLAYAFDAYEADTLTGVLMHFVPTVTDVSNYVMLLSVWDDNNGVPGNLLYQDNYFLPHYPQYGGSKNEFKYYEFVNPDYPSVIPVPKKFHVGWEQVESQSLNIGFDENIDRASNIHYNVSGNWITSSLSGSLMIRPVFSTNINYTLRDEEFFKEVAINMYPNPTSGDVNLQGLPSESEILVYDLSGRAVYSVSNQSQFNLGFLESGVYIVKVVDAEGKSIFTEKLIKE